MRVEARLDGSTALLFPGHYLDVACDPKADAADGCSTTAARLKASVANASRVEARRVDSHAPLRQLLPSLQSRTAFDLILPSAHALRGRRTNRKRQLDALGILKFPLRHPSIQTAGLMRPGSLRVYRPEPHSGITLVMPQ